MHLEVDVSAYHDWELRHVSQIATDDVAIPSHHSSELRNVRVTHDQANVVSVHVPDQDIDRMEEEHLEAVAAASRGYTAIHEGGPQHGTEIVVPPRSLPLKSRRRLLADHLADAVLPHHAPSDRVVGVRILDAPGLDEVESASLERYLNRRLVEKESVELAEETEQ